VFFTKWKRWGKRPKKSAASCLIREEMKNKRIRAAKKKGDQCQNAGSKEKALKKKHKTVW